MQNNKITITCKSLDQSYLNNSKVRIFYFRQEDHFFNSDSLRDKLSEEEKKRSQAFRFEKDRFSYIVCHGLLRTILSEEIGIEPEAIDIKKDANEKPYIENEMLYFNISHTKNICIVAFSREYEIGIDIEKIKENKHFKNIAKRYFTEDEQNLLNNSKNAVNDFFLIWTRKESFLKNIGTGIKTGLKNINVGNVLNQIDYEPVAKYMLRKPGNKFFIYSGMIEDHVLSITLTGESSIEINKF